MKLLRTVKQGVCVGVCLALVGCSLSNYNGGWSMNRRQKKTVEAYHKFLQERDLAMKQAVVSPTALVAGARPAVDPMAVTPAWDPAAASSAEPLIQPSGFNANMPGAAPAFTPSNYPMPVATPAPRAMPKPIRRSSARSVDVFGSLPQSPVNGNGEDAARNITRVTMADEGGDFDPCISPDGKWIAYASTRHHETSDIYIQSVTGTTLTQITNDPSRDVTPVFSPDGKKLAFASNRTGNWDIYIVDIQGGQPVQITNAPTHELSPSFSADGRWLVYSTLGNQSGGWEMVVINIQNPSVKRFIGFGLFPRWSPVDNRILFQRARQRGTQWFSIWTVQLINGEAMRPTEIIASSNAAVVTPSWSPDASHIVFATVANHGPQNKNSPPPVSDVWVAALDGTGRTNLTRSRFSNLQPAWGNNGNIYFVSNRGKGAIENVWSIRPDRALQTMQSIGEMAGPAVPGILPGSPGSPGSPGTLGTISPVGMASVPVAPSVEERLIEPMK